MSFIRFCQAVISVVLFLWLFSTPPVQAQDGSQIRFEQFTTEHGLVSSWIRGGIVQDQHGFLWVATEAGLSRFDGYRFKSYQHRQDDPTSLINDSIRAIDIDANDLIWLATGGGLNKFDPASETFTQFTPDPADPTILSGNNIQTIVPVQDEPGWLWVGIDRGGLNKFDPATQTIIRYEHDPLVLTSLSDNNAIAIFTDQSGMLLSARLNSTLAKFGAAATAQPIRTGPVCPATAAYPPPQKNRPLIKPGMESRLQPVPRLILKELSARLAPHTLLM